MEIQIKIHLQDVAILKLNSIKITTHSTRSGLRCIVK